MKYNLLILSTIISLCCIENVFPQESAPSFRPAVFWEGSAEKGVLLVNKNEMVFLDSKGQRYGKVVSKDTVSNAQLSPDGKKLLYTTNSGVWHASIETGLSVLVMSGFCDYLRWSSDSLSLMFSIYEKKENATGDMYNIKLYWADGEGKNMKQVYP